ncbi:reverse transcriptase [Olea europaea subsp. europaea]|uniref:Reverse transcriptase n=1 Tax=Olea europaea subsp. europaea TaxID=158383 RepID=A0A8S0UTT4_OLEEU|nr:reverse transcriptase [Olea europaea subsp. europaea]
MDIGVSEIDFLKMHIKDGQYSLQPHVGQESLKFPNTDLSKKEVQQFLGIENYMANFVDRLSPVIKPLQNMLKKNATPWSSKLTEAVRKIKKMYKDYQLCLFLLFRRYFCKLMQVIYTGQ